MSISKDHLTSVLSYDPDTGEFRWREGVGLGAKSGRIAGHPDSCGHLQIVIDRRPYSAHRLAWLYAHGSWPKNQIDHINGVRHDNRLCNLREATRSENQQNVSKRGNATSKFLGVTWHKGAKKWHAKIQANGRQFSLGYHCTEEAAHEAYKAGKARLHKFNPSIRKGAHKSGTAA